MENLVASHQILRVSRHQRRSEQTNKGRVCDLPEGSLAELLSAPWRNWPGVERQCENYVIVSLSYVIITPLYITMENYHV